MKAEITLSQLWMNPSVMDFFMRKQAKETLEDLLLHQVLDHIKAIEQIEDYVCDNDLDLDWLEETLYDESIEFIIDLFGLEPIEEYAFDEEGE